MAAVGNVVEQALHAQARFRATKVEEYPEDSRNARSADRLQQLGTYIARLPASDPRLDDLAVLVSDGVASFSPELAQHVSRVGFDREDLDLDQLTSWLAIEARSEPARWEELAR